MESPARQLPAAGWMSHSWVPAITFVAASTLSLGSRGPGSIVLLRPARFGRFGPRADFKGEGSQSGH
jgi:hypothetical protein